MEEMNNVMMDEVTTEEMVPEMDNFEALEPVEDEVVETESNGSVGTILVLGATAVAGYVVGSKVVPLAKKGGKKLLDGVKNVASKRKEKKKSKKDKTEDETVIDVEAKEVEETPEEVKEEVKG